MNGWTFAALALGIVAIATPGWLLWAVTKRVAGRPRTVVQGSRYAAYRNATAQLVDELRSTSPRAPLTVVSVRELGNYPEYADITIGLLEELTVPGDSRFDNLLRDEIGRTKAKLTDTSHD